MRILVCLKLVSRSTFTDSFNPGGCTERLAGGTPVANPADEYALELALRLKDREKSAEVSVITMASQSASPMLRNALAMGADRAYHVCDRAFAGADTIATAKILAGAVTLTGPYDYIFCGKNAIDSETGHIGPQLAALLEYRYFSDILDLRQIDNTLHVCRAELDGSREYIAETNALISVINGTSMVRQPTIMGRRNAAKKEIVMLDSTDIEPAASGTTTVKVIEKPFARRSGPVERDFQTGVKRLAAFLGSRR